MKTNDDTCFEKVARLEEFIALKDKLKLDARLTYLFWEATLRCNLSCLHCGSDCFSDNSTRHLEISADTIKKELEDISRHYDPRRCTFAVVGGEPLVREDIFEIGAFATKLGFHFGITTNGLLLHQENIERLKQAGLRTIAVSLDGVEAHHDQLRNRPGAYVRTVENIRHLMRDPFYAFFDVICVVSRININHLHLFVEQLIDIGVPAVRFTPVFSRGRAQKNSDMMLKADELQKLLTFVAEQRETNGRIVCSLSEEGYYGPNWECRIRDGFHYCSSGISTGTILHDGRITGCPSVSREFVQGTLSDGGFVKTWQTGFQRYRGDRKKHFSHLCGDCDHWELCEGGGYHMLDQKDLGTDFCALKKTGGLHGPA